MTDLALEGAAPLPAGSRRRQISREEWAARLLLAALALWLATTVLLPLASLFSRCFTSRDGSFVGLANFTRYFATPALSGSIVNSLLVAGLSTIICIALAFLFAYALTRTCMPGCGFFRIISQVPLLAPSLLPAISLIYLFGNQGLLTPLLLGQSIYGPIGIVVGSVFWTFPHALIILVTALSLSDARLYEAAEALGASRWRIFWTVTLPGARYGLISAVFVVFTLVITDFGVAKVIGGQFNVLATDIYKQVVGQQNFAMGAVVGVILLLPALVAFLIDRLVQRKQMAQLTARAVPYQPRQNRLADWSLFAFCAVMTIVFLGMLGASFFASIAKLWPYDLSLSLKNYDFDLMDGGGWASYRNSLTMAALTATIGAAMIFLGAYLTEKTRGQRLLRTLIQFLALLPLAVPGLVLGLGYIFFFNSAANPLHILYGTLAILVICTIAHFYSVAHLTAVTALKQMDPEFETVSASLKVPFYRTLVRVHVPVCLPAILDIAIYLFVNAMTTVSAVVFLYSPNTTLAAIAVLNMDDAGDIAPAAAMAMMIFFTATLVRILYAFVARILLARTQHWRSR